MASTRKTFKSGNWVGVITIPEPEEPQTQANTLADLKNGYLADPPNPSAAYGRPGVTLSNGGDPVDVDGEWQMFYTHTDLDAVRTNFACRNGVLYRVNPQLTIFEDVSPVGIAIDNGVGVRLQGASLIGTLIFTDGVNRPWIATNLTSTPITGTYIDYDGAGVAWTAYAIPAVYGGSDFLILDEVNGVSRRADVSWSQGGSPAIGWQQADYDNNWTLSQNDAGPLFAIIGTNSGLYYFRTESIGVAAGEVGPDLASTATEDAVSFNVGTQSAATIVKFGSSIYFADTLGRPYRFTPGSPPQDIWKQMRGVVATASTGYPTTIAQVASAVLEPTLNLYIVAPWSPTPSINAPPQRAYVFDAPSATYMGYWTFDDDGDGGVGIELLGVLTDSAGRNTMMIGAEGGYVYAFNGLSSLPQFRVTEAGDIRVTEAGIDRTTEGLEAVWTDNGMVPDIRIVAGKFGYSEDVNWNGDRATVITLNDTPVRVTAVASMSASEVEGIPEPWNTQDDTYRLVVGVDVMGRGPQLTVSPTSADSQCIVNSVSFTGVASIAGPNDG